MARKSGRQSQRGTKQKQQRSRNQRQQRSRNQRQQRSRSQRQQRSRSQRQQRSRSQRQQRSRSRSSNTRRQSGPKKPNTHKTRKQKRPMNAFMQQLNEARNSNSPSFQYNGKSYNRRELKTGMVVYKSA